MGDDVYLAAAGFLHQFLYTHGKLRTAFFNGRRGLLLAVEYLGAVCLQLRRNAPPVVHQLAVPEEYSVHEQERILRTAELIVPAVGVYDGFPAVLGALTADFTVDKRQHDQVRWGDHSQGDTPGAVLYPQLDGGAVNPDYSVPEYHQFHQEKHNAEFHGRLRGDLPGKCRP